MNFDQNKRDSVAGQIVQTASVGNSEMLTYIKIPSPTDVNGNQNSSPLGPANEVDGSNDNMEDDGTFLDGLFDRISGGSDSGSDKGDNSEPQSQIKSPAVMQLNQNLNQNQSCTPQDSTPDNGGSIMQQPISALHNPLTTSPNTNTSTLNVPAQQSTAGNQSQSVQLPQHMLYHVQHQALPTNLLQQQQQQQQQQQGVLMQQIQQQMATNNVQNQNNSGIQLQPWMMSAAIQLGVQAGQMQAQNQAQMQNQANQAQAQAQANQLQNQAQAQAQAQAQLSLESQQLPSSQVPTNTTGNVMQVPQVNSAPTPNITQSPRTIVSDTSAQIIPQTHTSSDVIPTKSAPAAISRPNRKRPNPFTDAPTTTATPSSAPSTIVEDASESHKRRRDRNMREQERSQRIASQIAHLKELLSQSKVSFKPDKYSTLVSVYQYISTLRQRIGALDSEHKKILDTIAKTNEVVNRAANGSQAYVPAEQEVPVQQVISEESGSVVQVIPSTTPKKEDDEEEELLCFVRGLDYKNIFFKSDIAMCVARIDGKLVDCNEEFIKLCAMKKEIFEAAGFHKTVGTTASNPLPDQVLSQGDGNDPPKKTLSLFNFLARKDMSIVFAAMSTMLKSTTADTECQNRGQLISEKNFWSQEIEKFGETELKVRINVSLVRLKSGTPKFFNCALFPV